MEDSYKIRVDCKKLVAKESGWAEVLENWRENVERGKLLSEGHWSLEYKRLDPIPFREGVEVREDSMIVRQRLTREQMRQMGYLPLEQV